MVATFKPLLVELRSAPAIAAAFIAVGDCPQWLVISVVRGHAGKLFLAFSISCPPMVVDQIAQRHWFAGRSGIKGTLLSLRALPRFPQQDNLLARGQSSPLGQGTNQQFSATGRVSDYRVDEFVQAMSGQCGKAGFCTKPLDVGPDSGLIIFGHTRCYPTSIRTPTTFRQRQHFPVDRRQPSDGGRCGRR
ncbi:hypothetical protein A5761_17805 [Mycolicibacterium setense]|nr:hypothetical protein A5761_17805 [Mycolicibacterium setense]